MKSLVTGVLDTLSPTPSSSLYVGDRPPNAGVFYEVDEEAEFEASKLAADLANRTTEAIRSESANEGWGFNFTLNDFAVYSISDEEEA